MKLLSLHLSVLFSCYALAMLLVKPEATNLKKITLNDGTEIERESFPQLGPRDYLNNVETTGANFSGFTTLFVNTSSPKLPSGRYYGGSYTPYRASDLSPLYQVNPHEFWGVVEFTDDIHGHWVLHSVYRYKYSLELTYPNATQKSFDVVCLCIEYNPCSCENVYPKGNGTFTTDQTVPVDEYFNELPISRYFITNENNRTVYYINGTLDNSTETTHKNAAASKPWSNSIALVLIPLGLILV